MNYEANEHEAAVQSTKSFYNQFARYYDDFIPSKSDRAKRATPLLNYISAETGKPVEKLRILELGCGTGSYSIPMAEEVAHVTGVDISDGMKKIAYEKIEGSSQTNFTFIESDWIVALKTWEDEFDCILCIGNSLAHNPQSSLDTLFNGCYNALIPNGILILNSRRIEKELELIDGPDNSQSEVVRSGGPALFPDQTVKNVLRFMFMNKSIKDDTGDIVFSFYTYDNYQKDGRRFVCHVLRFCKSAEKNKEEIYYDCWSTKTYFIYEKEVLHKLEMSKFINVREDNPDTEHIKTDKNWYIVAQKQMK